MYKLYRFFGHLNTLTCAMNILLVPTSIAVGAIGVALFNALCAAITFFGAYAAFTVAERINASSANS